MRRDDGFTILELLVALALIAIAFFALAMSQLSDLRATARSRASTEIKASANRSLETLMASVLKVDSVTVGDALDDTRLQETPQGRRFWFIDYYFQCPTAVTPTGARTTLGSVECSGSEEADGIGTAWTIVGENGTLGEGSILITVTSTSGQTGSSFTLVDRISCYDVYPSPKSTAPEPCPVPTEYGGGRL